MRQRNCFIIVLPKTPAPYAGDEGLERLETSSASGVNFKRPGFPPRSLGVNLLRKLRTFSPEKFITIVFLLLFSLFGAPEKAYAYLDLGSGSFIFQLILGTLFGVVFSLSAFWRKIFKFFLRIFPKQKEEKEESDRS